MASQTLFRSCLFAVVVVALSGCMLSTVGLIALVNGIVGA
jgi:hypothetical protein